MHYQSFVIIYLRNALLLLLLLANIGVFAQNNTSPQLPITVPDPTQPKVDPSKVTNQQAVDFYNQAKSAGMSDMDIERAALQRGYTLDQISTMRKRLQSKPDEKQPNDPNRDELDETNWMKPGIRTMPTSWKMKLITSAIPPTHAGHGAAG
jgi:polysaccharide biosynthesis/export protein